METFPAGQCLVVNFNSPELNQLAGACARLGRLAGCVRPYVNKGRPWEKLLARLPLAGPAYAQTFGRRHWPDVALSALTFEAGIAPDMLAAAAGRLPLLAASRRLAWQNQLYKRVRLAVAEEARQRASAADCVVAYEGFALPAFQALRQHGRGLAVLNYPVAHHRHRRRVRIQENLREPAFASTWPDFDDWPTGHEAQLDAEIELADVVLLGSSYARDTFVAEGVAPDKLVVVPYGVDLSLFHAGARPPPESPPGPRFEALFSGQLTQRKGLSYLLRGYEQFSSAAGRTGTQLTLVGSLVGRADVPAPFGNTCRHLAHQTRPQLAGLYRAADVFVFPTLVEGMPLVVLEAMACGLPVIVTGNGPSDIVRNDVDGLVIQERSAEAVCQALTTLHGNPALCAQMGRNAAERARQFGWNAYTANVLNALDARRA